MTGHLIRGDIIDVDLRGAEGREKANDRLSGGRVCVVVQNDVGNKFSPTTIIVPLTDGRRDRILPTQVLITPEKLGFARAKLSIAACEHVRSIDVKLRVREHLGRLGPDEMQRIDVALAISVGLAPVPQSRT